MRVAPGSTAAAAQPALAPLTELLRGRLLHRAHRLLVDDEGDIYDSDGQNVTQLVAAARGGHVSPAFLGAVARQARNAQDAAAYERMLIRVMADVGAAPLAGGAGEVVVAMRTGRRGRGFAGSEVVVFPGRHVTMPSSFRPSISVYQQDVDLFCCFTGISVLLPAL